MYYSRLFGSNFPDVSIPVGSRKDIDDGVVVLINKYNSYVQSNDMVSAYSFYERNKDVLEPYMINMSYINRLEEEIYNTGLYAMLIKNGGTIFSTQEPTIEQSDGSYWFQDY